MDIFAEHVARLFVKPSDKQGRMLHAVMGVAGESGELIDAIKKHWIYGAPLDLANVLEESGDLLFYLQALLTECGFSMSEAMEHNVRKLKTRYPLGYTDEAARERADKSEKSEKRVHRKTPESGLDYCYYCGISEMEAALVTVDLVLVCQDCKQEEHP